MVPVVPETRRMALVKFLRTIPLLSFLPDQELRKLASQVIEQHYVNNEFVFRDGDHAEWLYFIKNGVIRCLKYGPDGKKFILKPLLPGDSFCCESVTFDQSLAHPGNAQAMGNVTILKISRRTYLQLIEQYPRAGPQIISYLGRRLRESQEVAKGLALDPAEKRLASLIVRLAEKVGEPSKQGLRLTVVFTRDDLGHMSGMTEETVVRILSRWREQGLIATNGGKNLVILTFHALKALAS
jgi:CRP-like cAMP-binding protein